MTPGTEGRHDPDAEANMTPVTDEIQDAPPAPAEPSKRRLPGWAVGMLWTTAGIVAAVVTVTALNAPHTGTPTAGPAPTTAPVQGWIQVGNAALLNTAGDPCTTATSPGYGDITSGAEVDVLDNAGKILAIGHLDDGVAEDNGSCQFGFTVPSVPNGDTIYGVKVGSQARGVVHFTKAQMFSDGPQLTLGITP